MIRFAAALLMVPWLVKEGIEGIRGEEEDSDQDSTQTPFP